ncbi:MAG: 1-phosphofructokinase family hexose kinase [Gammaproteobacteria bacterium]|nr:1-phosphofructokinase family hexose kinase [Gammaproteobacteria bacterium]
MTERILTLTLNPAVDITCATPRVLPDHKLRTSEEQYDPGGGGVNVARVVHDLGGEARALIMVGGATGLLYEELLGAHGVPYSAIPIRGRTRVAMNVHESDSGRAFRFVTPGPVLSAEEWQSVLDHLQHSEAEWIVASGSLPRGVPEDFYARAAEIARRRGQHFVLDTSGPALAHALRKGIALAKPSRREFESLVGQPLADDAALEAAALKLVREHAAQMLVISLAGQGALLATAQGVHRLPALEVSVRSEVGAGDSFVAGMVLGLARGEAAERAFARGMAAGAAAVSSAGTAHPDPTLVEALLARLLTVE